MRRSWLTKRLKELGVKLDRATVDRLFDVARSYDEVLRVEVGEKTVTIGLKCYNGGSPNRLTVHHKVERITVPLLEEVRLFWVSI